MHANINESWYLYCEVLCAPKQQQNHDEGGPRNQYASREPFKSGSPADSNGDRCAIEEGCPGLDCGIVILQPSRHALGIAVALKNIGT